MKNLMKALGIAVLVSGIALSASAQTAPATTAPAKTTQAPAAAPAKAAPADKIVGKDAKGNNIYEGPKGGRYTLDAKGAKHYLPKEAKPATTPATTTTPAPKNSN